MSYLLYFSPPRGYAGWALKPTKSESTSTKITNSEWREDTKHSRDENTEWEKKNLLNFLWLRHQKGFIIKWKYCKSWVRQDAGAHAHKSYCWSDNIKHLDCWDFSIPDFPMSCTTKQGRIPSSGVVECWQWSSAETHEVRGAGASSEHKQGREDHWSIPAPSWKFLWKCRVKVVLGEGRDASDNPRANTNENISERIKKGWGRVSPTPSPAVIAPVLRGVASSG